jgi:Domain of unknown function (DUF5664)
MAESTKMTDIAFSNTADAFGKNRVDFIPAVSLLKVGECMTSGASKHGPFLPSEDKRSVEDHIAASLRHIYKHQTGEKIDSEFGHPHLVHAAARLLMAVARA